MINKFIKSERELQREHLEARMKATLYIYSISSASQKVELEPIMENYNLMYMRVNDGIPYKPVFDELQKRENQLEVTANNG